MLGRLRQNLERHCRNSAGSAQVEQIRSSFERGAIATLSLSITSVGAMLMTPLINPDVATFINVFTVEPTR
jgi:hypothetical protein